MGMRPGIVETLRHHYGYVAFVIPNCAFSAGTVLVMSGDDIYMDYYSRLGPIDPQVETENGKMVPPLGYLAQYRRLLDAEAQLLIDGFDQAELHKYEQARELSIALLKEWLAKYKFKDWKVTESRGIPVTDRDVRSLLHVEEAAMPNRVTLDQVIARNPHIDRGQFEQASELRRELQRLGRRGAKYRLASPSSYRRVSVSGDAGSDPRTIHLGDRR